MLELYLNSGTCGTLLQLEANLFVCAAFKRYAKSANTEKLSWMNTLSASVTETDWQFSQYWPLKKIYERVISTLADAVEVPLWTRLALNRYVSWSDHFFPKDLSSVKAFKKKPKINRVSEPTRADLALRAGLVQLRSHAAQLRMRKVESGDAAESPGVLLGRLQSA